MSPSWVVEAVDVLGGALDVVDVEPVGLELDAKPKDEKKLSVTALSQQFLLASRSDDTASRQRVNRSSTTAMYTKPVCVRR